MSYLSINEYPRKWIFTHASMPVDEGVLALIKPMTQARSAQFWKENISDQSPDAERLSNSDWPRKRRVGRMKLTGWLSGRVTTQPYQMSFCNT